MKNLFVFLILFFLLSCSKTQTSNDEENLLSALSPEAKATLAQKDLTAMKQSYSMLSDEDQEQLWRTKLSYILRHDRLTNGQSVLIKKMLNFLSETGMTTMKNDNMIPVKFIQENANEFYRHFSSEQLYFVIEHPFVKYGFSLRHVKDYMKELGFFKNHSSMVVKEEVAGSCTCRYDIGCGFGNYCKKGRCSGGKDCGLFGTSACKGYCVQGNGGPVLYEEAFN